VASTLPLPLLLPLLLLPDTLLLLTLLRAARYYYYYSFHHYYSPTNSPRPRQVPDSEKKAKAGKAKRTKRKGDVYWGKLKRGENMIGRSGECQIIIDDSKASRQHARIDIDADDNVVFLDLGSSRGAKVNGKTVSGRTPMSVGDQIKIGSTVMTLTVNDGLDEGELKE